MLEKAMKILFGSKHERDLKEILPLLHRINELEPWAASLDEEAFSKQTEIFRKRYKEGEGLDAMLPEAFALVREAARRTLGERHYDVQLLGGIVLHQGKIMEMKTGEGKTLSSVSAAYLNAIPGKGVHVVTVNDYLAGRDALWMEPVFSYLGISVGSILSEMDNEARKEAYSKDITYGTNNEFGFDYLRDNMRWSIDGRVQRGHNYCIVDEIDSILIDEARTPLIISGQADDDTKKFQDVNRLVSQLQECKKDPETGDYPEENPEGDFQIEEKSKKVTFTDEGMNHIEELLQKNHIIDATLFTDENFEFIHYFTQALKAHKLFHIDVDYVVKEKQVQIVDEFTGRILHGRRYSDGLHQAIEAKEGIKVAKRNKTLATITFQNYFRMYDKISGMTGTADTEAREFGKIYNLEVVVIPTNRPLARADEDDVIFLTEAFKYDAICEEIAALQKKGQPVLVGTVSIEKSELLSRMLTKKGVRHEVLNAKNHAREALIIAEAGAEGSVTIATNMAGRGTDIKLGGNPEFRVRSRIGTEASEEEFSAAYKKEYESWRKDYNRVKEVGGLYILGTERHESRRIDNQLRGRSGRQGDPGTSRFFLSLDDNLMRLFARDNVRNLMSKAGMAGGDPLYHPWINKAIEKAQTRVEERNFDIRKHLLEYDDVLNEQRKFIYSQRDTILQDGDLKERVFSAIEDIVALAASEAVKEGENPETIRSIVAEKLKENLLSHPDLSNREFHWKNEEILSGELAELYKEEVRQKISSVGESAFNDFIRYQYLRQIDVRWQDHLDQLDELREAVYLRAYGQKNPLLEYKLEGFDIFDKLINNIRTNIARLVVNVTIEEPDGAKRRRAPIGSGTASHSAVSMFGGRAPSGGRSGGEAREATPQAAQVKRSLPKVGRNDPCPCGSGKKYKHCCGR
jgi:preprotein translocase subunit SecA